MSNWGQGVNNTSGWGLSTSAIERTTELLDVRVTESGEYRTTENSGGESYGSIYLASWSGATDLIKEG